MLDKRKTLLLGGHTFLGRNIIDMHERLQSLQLEVASREDLPTIVSHRVYDSVEPSSNAGFPLYPRKYSDLLVPEGLYKHVIFCDEPQYLHDAVYLANQLQADKFIYLNTQFDGECPNDFSTNEKAAIVSFRGETLVIRGFHLMGRHQPKHSLPYRLATEPYVKIYGSQHHSWLNVQDAACAIYQSVDISSDKPINLISELSIPDIMLHLFFERALKKNIYVTVHPLSEGDALHRGLQFKLLPEQIGHPDLSINRDWNSRFVDALKQLILYVNGVHK